MDVLDPAPTFSESVYTEEILEGTYTAVSWPWALLNSRKVYDNVNVVNKIK